MANVETREEQVLLDEARGREHRNAELLGVRKSLVAVGLVALGVVLGISLAPTAPSVSNRLVSKSADALLLEEISDGSDGSCPVPKDWCKGTPTRKDTLMFRDCDGDGILDPYCEGGELLRFGYIGSKNDCKDTWPNGLCSRPTGGSEGVATVKHAASNEITFIHFNDVYEVSGVLVHGRRYGGMSRAQHVVDEQRARNPDRTFTVFAGDVLSPSVLSNMFEGKQMIDILNLMKLDAASLGNHEFDFGVDTLKKRLGESKFPWLNINLLNETGDLLPNTQKRFIKEVPFASVWNPSSQLTTKVCMFGVSYDVRESLSKDVERIKFTEVIPAAKAEAEHLRNVEKCDVVVALTHQFEKDDCDMSAALGDSVDLILGGHDHTTAYATVCGHAPYAKAASDLKSQWIVTLWLDDAGKVESIDGEMLSLTDADPFNVDMHDTIVSWEEEAEKELGKTVGCFKEGVDTITSHVRTQEANSGNFICDAIRDYFGTEVALMNGGAIRGNKLFKGDMTMRDLMEMDPFSSVIAKIYATGKELKDYVNSCLDCIEDPCGDFLQISGLKYEFDSSKPKGHRFIKLMTEDGKDIDDKRDFTVALTLFQLNSSPLKKNRLYNMVTPNDAQPLLPALASVLKKGADACVSPEFDGRVKDLAK